MHREDPAVVQRRTEELAEKARRGDGWLSTVHPRRAPFDRPVDETPPPSLSDAEFAKLPALAQNQLLADIAMYELFPELRT